MMHGQWTKSARSHKPSFYWYWFYRLYVYGKELKHTKTDIYYKHESRLQIAHINMPLVS